MISVVRPVAKFLVCALYVSAIVLMSAELPFTMSRALQVFVLIALAFTLDRRTDGHA